MFAHFVTRYNYLADVTDTILPLERSNLCRYYRHMAWYYMLLSC